MIYLDHNATAPLHPRAREAMLPWLGGRFGNPSSRDHAFGWDAAEAVEDARAQVAGAVGAGHHEIFFASGATEALSIALRGLFPDGTGAGGILATAVEHASLLDACRDRARQGAALDLLPVDGAGRLDLADLERMLAARRPRLVCVMAANNETGVRFPVRACAGLAHAHGALLLSDMAQALGRISVDVGAEGADVAVFSAHKMGGPQGAGALYLRGGREAISGFAAAGAGAEGGLRPGTLNVAALAGFGGACEAAIEDLEAEAARLAALRDTLEASLLASIPGAAVNGAGEARLPNTANIRFPRVRARELLRAVPEVAASTRSACSTGSAAPSHVLAAMGLPEEEAWASIRFSLGRATTAEGIERAAELLAGAWRRLVRG